MQSARGCSTELRPVHPYHSLSFFCSPLLVFIIIIIILLPLKNQIVLNLETIEILSCSQAFVAVCGQTIAPPLSATSEPHRVIQPAVLAGIKLGTRGANAQTTHIQLHV